MNLLNNFQFNLLFCALNHEKDGPVQFVHILMLNCEKLDLSSSSFKMWHYVQHVANDSVHVANLKNKMSYNTKVGLVELSWTALI